MKFTKLTPTYFILFGILLFVFILIFVFWINFRSSDLDRILTASIVTSDLVSGRETNRIIQEGGRSLGKPLRAQLTIEFVPQAGYEEEDVYKEIVSTLETTNWIREESNLDRIYYYRAYLPQQGFSISAEVNVQSDRNIVSLNLFQGPPR